MRVKFSYIVSPTLKTKHGPLSNIEKGKVMSETSGSNRFGLIDIEMSKIALDDFLHSPVVFSGHEFLDGKRDMEHYVKTNVLVIDIDEGMSVKEVESKLKEIEGNPFYHISYSSNHSPGVHDKMHIILPLKEPITNLEDHELMARWVHQLFPHSDASVRNDVARGIIRSSPEFREHTILGGTSPLFTSLVLDEARKDQVVHTVPALKVEEYFKLDTKIFDKNRNVYTVSDLITALNSPTMKSKPIRDQKIPIFCPVCGFDTKLRSENNPARMAQNAFIRLGKSDIPYINCRSCASRNHGHDKKGSWFLEPNEQMWLSAEKNDSLVFRDQATDKWYHFGYSLIDEEYRFWPLNKVTSIKSVLKHELDLNIQNLEDLPAYQMGIRYDIDKQFDIKRKFVNEFVECQIMKNARKKAKSTPTELPVPPMCWNLFKHIAGDDERMTNLFLDWLAYLFQERKKAFTAWLFQGVQGTGKDLIFEHVLSPVFGHDYCTSIDQDRLLSRFNAKLSKNILIKVNEIQIDFNQQQEKTAAALKTAIGDIRMEMEKKGLESANARNIASLIAFSNKYNSVVIEFSDRRWNVCERQEVKLIQADWFTSAFKSPQELIAYLQKNEVQAFADHLATRQYNPSDIINVHETKAKQALIHMSKSYSEELFDAYDPGNVDWNALEELLNSDEDATAASLVASKKQLPDDDMSKHYLTVDELKALYENIILGGREITRIKFVRLLNHHGFVNAVKKINGKSERRVLKRTQDT